MLNTNSIKQTVKSRFFVGKQITVIFAMLLLLATLFATSQTAPLKQWDARFGGKNNDFLYSLQQTTDGGYILGGYSASVISGDKTQASQGNKDYWIVKTDANGAKQWDATFGGSAGDYLYSLQQTSDGGYILGGHSKSGISGDKTQESQGDEDYWIVKTDAIGVKQWDARFGGSALDELYSVQQTSDGGYILGGHSDSGISGDKTQANHNIYEDYWIVKTDANGIKEWDAAFGGNDNDFFSSLQQTDDGGYILGGHSDSGISGDKTQASQSPFLHDYWIVKTDANGIKQWDAAFGGNNNDFLYSLQQTSDGGYILGGYSYSTISGDKTQSSQGLADYWIVKSDANGVKQWDATFGGSDYDFLLSLEQAADGGYILGGWSSSGISGDKTQANLGGADYWIVRTDSNGIKKWDAGFGGGSYDYLTSLQRTVPSGYILGGYSYSGIGGDKTQKSRGADDYWIVKVESDCDGGSIVYADADGDGYGNITSPLFVADCIAPSGYVHDNTDCDDTNAAINPGTIEILNGIDDDCNGIIDDVVCQIPSNLSVVNITSSSAKLKWNTAPAAVAYKVRYKVANTSDWKKGTTYNISKPISGLSPNTVYEWQVETFCQIVPEVNSAWSFLQTFTTGSLRISDELLQQISFQIYPNPAEDRTTIQFTLPQSSHVYIKVYDVSGKEMETVLNEEMEQGDHSLLLNTNHFSKGVYLVKMISDFGTTNQKLIVE